MSPSTAATRIRRRAAKPVPEPAHLQRERAHEELKRRLLEGQLSGRPLLSARGLAKELGLGNTPVRSAIERLEAEGLILISPQRGIVVRQLTPKEILDHYEIRSALESFILRRLAGNLTDEQAKQLRSNLDRQRKAATVRDTAALVEADAEFHLLLSEFQGNGEIRRTLNQLRDKIRLVIGRVAGQYPARMLQSAEEHAQIGKALLKGKGDLAAKLLVRHLERGRDLLLPAAT